MRPVPLPVPLFAVAAGALVALGVLTARGLRPATAPELLSGASGTAPAPDRPPTHTAAHDSPRDEAGLPSQDTASQDTGPTPRARARAWAELLRVSALFSVPGDALAGAAAVGRRPHRGTALAVGASLCLYEAGMALNDWADRDEDAIDRPHRPIPSGRVAPGAALGAAAVLTAAGLVLAARAGRPAFAVATGLAATVWAYDLRLKHTRLGPGAMAAARSLDLLLGATATTGGGRFSHPAHPVHSAHPAHSAHPGYSAHPGHSRAAVPVRALPAALLLGAHTYAVTAVSRHEAQGGSTGAPLAALAATVAFAATVAGGFRGAGAPPPAPRGDRPGEPPRTLRTPDRLLHALPMPDRLLHALLMPDRLLHALRTPDRLLLTVFAAGYLRTAGVPLLHAALNPSPPLTQRAVGGGIRAMIPLQAALAARAGAPLTGLAVMGLVPLARSLARKVSPT